jgi:hypothetical protein
VGEHDQEAVALNTNEPRKEETMETQNETAHDETEHRGSCRMVTRDSPEMHLNFSRPEWAMLDRWQEAQRLATLAGFACSEVSRQIGRPLTRQEYEGLDDRLFRALAGPMVDFVDSEIGLLRTEDVRAENAEEKIRMDTIAEERGRGFEYAMALLQRIPADGNGEDRKDLVGKLRDMRKTACEEPWRGEGDDGIPF